MFFGICHKEPLIKALPHLVLVTLKHRRRDRTLLGVIPVLQLIDHVVIDIFAGTASKKSEAYKKEEKTFHDFHHTLASMKKIAIIDPFIVSPSIHCFNHLVHHLEAKLSYHQPHKIGLETLGEHDGFIILGSASNVTEHEGWHKDLSDYMLGELQKKKSVLGICFGHQLMAHAFEAEVNFIKEDQEKLKGSRVVTFLEDFGSIKKGDTLRFAMTHQQMIKSLSPQLVEIAKGLPHDIIKHKSLPFTGIQPHPEGSLNFCQNNANISDKNEVKIVQKDGLFFVKQWLSTF